MQAAPREIRIGYLVDLSGPGSYFGANSILGATLAQEELESSELHIRLIVEDHATSSSRAASAAQKLIGVDKVEALYTETTPAVVPVSPIAQKAKIPFIGVAGATSFLSNPYAFKSFLDLEAACEAIATHWKSVGIKKLALLKIQFEAGDICAKGFRRVAPEGEIVSFDRGADVSTEILTLKRR